MSDGLPSKKRNIDEIEPESSSATVKKAREDEPITDLQNLLDFSSLNNATDAEISRRFREIAQKLLLNFHLVVRKTEFQILELEFYLWKARIHEDPFTHGSEEQKVPGQWYFHRAPRRSENSHENRTTSAGYRGGTRKGLDLTFGGSFTSSFFESQQDSSTEPTVRGGILLRSICTTGTTPQVISGPSLLVDEVLVKSNAASVQDLVNQKWEGNISAFRETGESMFLRPRASPVSAEVHCSPRIGLELSHPSTTASVTHPRVIYVSKPYRYFTHPELLTANGRAQTFAGILRASLDAGKNIKSEKLKRDISKICAMNEKTVGKYLSDYSEGLEKGVLKVYVGSLGKGVSSSASKYLRMLGTLEREREAVVA